jgi:four helix bundle protein
MRDYNRLEFWQRAHAQVIAISNVARRIRGRDFTSLRSLIKSAESVAATIVEGCGASSAKEFARFLEMSIKSGAETEYHLRSGRDRHAISYDDWRRLSSETIEIRKMTYVYRKKLLEDDT